MSDQPKDVPIAPADPPQSGEDLVKQARKAREQKDAMRRIPH